MRNFEIDSMGDIEAKAIERVNAEEGEGFFKRVVNGSETPNYS